MLVVDQRATGDSDGNVISFGINERYDVLAWTQMITKRFPKMKIILVGGSLRAATVLMASELDLPANVVGVVADSAYSSPKAIIKKVIDEMNLPATLTYPFVKLSAKILGHFNLEAASPIQAVKNTKLPILIVHGEDDHYVPCSMAYQNFNACQSPTKMLLTVPKGPHDISLLVDWDRYQSMVEQFFDKIGVPMKNK
ncbi:MAG: alpha/beta hydrolase [Acinetobacter sp.]|nr:alpha/beta hydrolase [Acinetobacter sp.]